MSFVSQYSFHFQSNHWQEGFLALLPAIQTHARIQFRRLTRERREEAVQEAIASAFVSYGQLASKGRLKFAHPGTLAAFAVKHVWAGRHVGGSQDGMTDVLSPAAQARHGFSTLGCAERAARNVHWKQMTIEDHRTPIPDLAAFNIDFAHWLARLDPRDRQIVAGLISGESAEAVARQMRLTPGRVSQLRDEYERNWEAFQAGAAVA